MQLDKKINWGTKIDKVKPSLFAGDMMVHLGNSWESMIKLKQ